MAGGGRPGYVGSDGRERSRTFDTRAEAERFLTQVRAQLLAGDWLDPSMGRVAFGRWLWSWWRARLLEETTRAAR